MNIDKDIYCAVLQAMISGYSNNNESYLVKYKDSIITNVLKVSEAATKQYEKAARDYVTKG